MHRAGAVRNRVPTATASHYPAPVVPELILHEDADLLVVNKPPGWNTHSPSPYTGEGVYDWLRHRQPRWAGLAIIHRLDKATSGVLVFAKSPLANRSLTGQFARREVAKTYRLATRHPVGFDRLVVRTGLRRQGERYLATPPGKAAELAETQFEVHQRSGEFTQMLATPVTGKTHQIRVHAAANGFPIFGDELYGGEPAARLWLHAESLQFRHPATGKPVTFRAPVDFALDPHRALREAIIDTEATDAWRVWHGAAEARGALPLREDGPAFYGDRFGPYLLAQSAVQLTADQLDFLRQVSERDGLRGVYHKPLRRDVRGKTSDQASPRLVLGEAASEAFAIRENGLRFEIRFGEGYSVGLFLDQRDNRRRLLVNHIAADFPVFPSGAADAEALNVFAYTCGFSLCAAKAGARTTSLDLSRKYLDWGRRNFALNGLDPAAHDFIYGDAFEWLRRLAKKGRRFDAVLLDPPTFSTSKPTGVFRAESDFGRLLAAALPLVKPAGLIFASTNAADLEPERFLEIARRAIEAGGRRIAKQHYAPQPPDFPVSRAEPAYLKTVWLRLD